MADSAAGGSMIALLIDRNIKSGSNEACFINAAQLKIRNNNLGDFRFRLHFFAVNKDTGEPGNDILEKNIVVNGNLKKGWINFDLHKENIEICEPFYVAFESIFTDEERRGIAKKANELAEALVSKTRVDTINVHGSKVVRTIIKGVPYGVMVGLSSSSSAYKKYVSYRKVSSESKWEKDSGILAAKVSISE